MKKTLDMGKAISVLAFVFSLGLCARGGSEFSGARFTTGTSFEDIPNGAFRANLDDQGGHTGSNYWSAVSDYAGAVVTNYADFSEPYPYQGTVRNDLFGKESRELPGANLKCLSLDSDTPLDRLAVLARLGDSGAMTASNVLVRTADYDGIYADTLVRFAPSVSTPYLDGTDKIVVWMRVTESGRAFSTNLVVTAGRYVDGFEKVEPVDYVIGDPVVPADTWCRLTIRAVADVLSDTLIRHPAFTVYLDGKPAMASADYSIGSGYRADRLTPEARILVAERRLFPWLAAAGDNKAMALTRFSFAGRGAVDDVLFTTERPGHVTPENVFTLQWDAGVKSFDCVVSNASGVVRSHVDATVRPRYRDYALGTNHFSRVSVTDVVYDTAHDYSAGDWSARNDCTVKDGVFTYNGENANPIGIVASSREVVLVGEGGVETFAEARQKALRTGVRTIALSSDIILTTGLQSGGYNDAGMFSITNGEDIILDLCGHELKGRFVAKPPVRQTGGRLCIRDSEGGGAVVPAEGGSTSVECFRSSKAICPELIVEDGRYDGRIVIDGTGGTAAFPKLLGVCVVDGGSFTNVTGDVRHFYLEQYVTNQVQHYGLDAKDYWALAAEGFIWCGKGANSRWTTASNWRCGAVPGVGDLAIFPYEPDGTDGWPVDFGEGVDTKELLMDGCVVMSGTNEFSDVHIIGDGRFVGNGVATFTAATGKELPGMLTANDSGSGEMRLGADWQGTVRISKVTRSSVLGNIMGWGTAFSRVEFNGVRGYLSDRANYALPYELILTDDGASPAWRNDTGYTGSVVSFPRLSGSGTFESPSNLREVLQVFQFKIVLDFTGRFKLGGKRILLGTGSVAQAAKAGHFTFSDSVFVRSGLGWDGVNAHFGQNLHVYGEFQQVLMTYKQKPAVENVLVTLCDEAGVPTGVTGALRAENGEVLLVSGETASVDGHQVDAENVADSALAGSTFEIPAGSAVTIDGNRVIVNGMVVSSFADYYKVLQTGGSTYSVQFDETEVTPDLADMALVPEGGKVVIEVRNAKPGLWYGVQTTSSLAADWNEPESWIQAEDTTLTLDPEVVGSASFFRVIMSDNPAGK